MRFSAGGKAKTPLTRIGLLMEGLAQHIASTSPHCKDSSHLDFSNSLASNIALPDLPTKECFMHNAIPLTLAALIAVAIIVIGCFYLVSPQRILGTFGLKPPASDADTRAWLRPK